MRKPLGKSLLASVAATALLAGIVAAEAQRGPEGGGDRSPAASSQSQQKPDRGNARSGPSAPTPRATSGAGSAEERKGDRLDRGAPGKSGSGQIEKRTPQGAQQQDKSKPQPSAAQERKGTTGASQTESRENRQGERSKQRAGESQRQNERSTTGQTRTQDSERMNRGDDRQNARERDSQRSRDQSSPAAREERSGTSNTREDRSATTNTREDRSSTSVRLNDEQRSRAVDVFSRQNVRSETNINVDVRVGARLPRSVRLHTVPREIVSINPRYRDFRYTVVHDEIVIINPRTYEVVEVIPRSGRATTGRAPAGDRSRINFSAEQRRMIRETVIKESSVPRCEDVRLTVGAEVSRSLRFSPFPEVVVREVPEIRQYRYCVHADDVVLIDPDEYRIVEVIQ